MITFLSFIITAIHLLSYRAYETYKSSVEAGDDGKENFHARKACEYLKMAVEVRKIQFED